MMYIATRTILFSTLVIGSWLYVPVVDGQSAVSQQKEAVVFIFGTVHPINPDKTPRLDAAGKPVALNMPLGTGFFVGYPDTRGGPNFTFCYLVTAKHVLRDSDGTFLRTVSLRVNLKPAVGDSNTDFITPIPVADENGNLVWIHGDNEADEAVAIPLLPDFQKVVFRMIPVSMFVNDAMLKSDDIEEGDNLYFVGLLAQFYGTKRNYPVVRRGTLALMTDENIQTPSGPQRAFIAELQSWPGNSGSPVFLNLGGFRHGGMILGSENLRFLGIVLGDFINKIPASIVGGQTIFLGADDASNVGISYIVPAMSLKSVLDSADAQKRRDGEIALLPKPSGSN